MCRCPVVGMSDLALHPAAPPARNAHDPVAERPNERRTGLLVPSRMPPMLAAAQPFEDRSGPLQRREAAHGVHARAANPRSLAPRFHTSSICWRSRFERERGAPRGGLTLALHSRDHDAVSGAARLLQAGQCRPRKACFHPPGHMHVDDAPPGKVASEMAGTRGFLSICDQSAKSDIEEGKLCPVTVIRRGARSPMS